MTEAKEITEDFFKQKLGKRKHYVLSVKDIYELFATNKGFTLQKDLNKLFDWLKEKEV